MKAQASRLDLHARLKRHTFDHAFITTFTFKVSFFEEYALETFSSLQSNANITVLVDAGRYQDLLKLAREQPTEFPKQANLRYLLHPIRVPGVFHPKISLFTSKRRGLLLIGSANFTPEGLGGNAEMVAAFDFELEKNETALSLFVSAVDYLKSIAERWPSEQLNSNLAELLRDTPWLSPTEAPLRAEGLPALLHNLDEPLWDQLVARVPGEVTEVATLSRYFDASPSFADHVFATTRANTLRIFTQNEVTTLTPAWLESEFFKGGRINIALCHYADEEYPQQLHAKAHAFICDDKVMLAVGSANFTTPALQRTANDGNVEILLCYPPVPTRKFRYARWFDPHESARDLKKPQDLRSATDNPDAPRPTEAMLPLCLAEAFVDDSNLELRVQGETSGLRLQCALLQAECRPEHMPVRLVSPGHFRVSLPEKLRKDLRSKPSLVQLIGGLGQETEPLSNHLLVTNLQDLETNLDLRRQRQIREARESPQRFIEVLNDISLSEDDERLKTFLTYCDIPIDLPVGLLRKRSSLSDYSSRQGGGLQALGQRNLRHFELLHDAVIHFAERHERRLRRHVDRGTVRGIPNFLHILLTIERLILSQIERVVVALESEAEVRMPVNRWHDSRQYLDAYFVRLRSLLQLMIHEYIPAMDKAADGDEARTAFADGIPGLINLIDTGTTQRDRLIHLVESRLKIETPSGSTTNAQFFKECLSPKKWPAMLREFDLIRQELGKLTA